MNWKKLPGAIKTVFRNPIVTCSTKLRSGGAVSITLMGNPWLSETDQFFVNDLFSMIEKYSEQLAKEKADAL